MLEEYRSLGVMGNGNGAASCTVGALMGLFGVLEEFSVYQGAIEAYINP